MMTPTDISRVLEQDGYHVRTVVRDAEKLMIEIWEDNTPKKFLWTNPLASIQEIRAGLLD